jgi:SlyX protein
VTIERIEALEFKVAHLERALQELSDVLYRQQQELDALRHTNGLLTEQLRQVSGPGADASSTEVPPHY